MPSKAEYLLVFIEVFSRKGDRRDVLNRNL